MSNMAGSPGSRPLEQLKVAELRDELKKRGLSLKGVKKELFERLEEAVKKDQQENVDGEHEEATQEGAQKSDNSDETEDVEEEAEALDRPKGEASKCDDTTTACQNKTSTDTPLPTNEESTPFSEEAHVSPAVSAPNEAPGSNEEREQVCTAGVENVEKNNDVVSVENAVCGNVDAMLVPEDVANVAGVLEPGKDTSVVEHVESGNDEKKHVFVVPELERLDALPESGVASSVIENVATDVLVQPVSAIDNAAPVIEASGVDCPMQDVESSNLKEDKLLILDSTTENSSSKADDDMSLVQPSTQALDTGKPVETSHEEVVGGVTMESSSAPSTASPKILEPHAGFKSEDLEKHNIDERDSIINEEKSDVKVEVVSKQEIVSEDGLEKSASPLIISEENSYVKVEVASKYEIVIEDGLEKSAVKFEPMEIETCSEERYEATCEVKTETEKIEEGTQQESPSPQSQLKEVKSEHAYLQKSRGEENAHRVPDDRRKDGATSKTVEEEDSQARINLKRKDNEADVKQEPAKRMRRWNSGKEVVVEPVKPLTTDSMKEIMLPDSTEGSSAVTPRSTPKTVATSRALPAMVKVEPEPINNTRTVPPSTRAPSNFLKIDRFVRPFTLKAVKDLLAEFGQCVDFWMDQIKTHCYVTYSSVDEAVAARSGLYGRRWPPLVGSCLVAEFVDVNEVKFRSEGLAEKAQVAPTAASMRVSNSTQVPPSRAGHTSLSFRSDPNALTASRFSREVQPSPLPQKDPEPAVVTLEDLFFKTKAKPHIYYLPLTDEQVAEKIKKKQAVR